MKMQVAAFVMRGIERYGAGDQRQTQMAAPDGAGFSHEEGRPAFLKKRSKKLLSILASALPDTIGPISQKFFGSFFQKRTAFFYP
jgi:hypothetical protein